MLAALRTVQRVADSSAPVLIHGEPGTGRELVARLLHARSSRAAGPFVALDCAVLPEQLLGSERLGLDGATGGESVRQLGGFERAEGGTLFLDNVTALGPALQAGVLQQIQQQDVGRAQGGHSAPAGVRVISATSRELASGVAEGRFLGELARRLAVVVLVLPPLRERGDDIRLLAEYYVARFAQQHGRPVFAIAHRTLTQLLTYAWPGNVRQLRHVIERAVLAADGPVLLPSHLPPLAREASAAAPDAAPPRRERRGRTRVPLDDLLPLSQLEREHIQRLVGVTGGHLTRAAELLGIHRNTLRRKLQEYGLPADERAAPRTGERDASATAPPADA